MNFLTDEELKKLLAVCAKYLRAVSLQCRVDAKLSEKIRVGSHRRLLYWLSDKIRGLRHRCKNDMEEALGATGWHTTMVERIPGDEQMYVVAALLLNQVAALRDEVRSERDAKYAALRQVGVQQEILDYIDTQMPVADSTCDEPGLPFVAAARRELGLP